MRTLPLSARTVEQLRGQCAFWYVRPVCFAALLEEPEARSATFAVARFCDEAAADGRSPRERLEHRVVLSPDPLARWPHAACRAANPLLDGRGARAVRRAHAKLYGDPEVDLDSRGAMLLAWGAYAKPDRRPSDHVGAAFAPVLSVRRREPREREYVPGPFAADVEFVGVVWSQDRAHGALCEDPLGASALADPALPAGMGAGELARLARVSRESPLSAPWSGALRRELDRALQVAEALAQGTASEADLAWLRGTGAGYALEWVESVLAQR